MDDSTKGKGFHSYSIRCDESAIYFAIDGKPIGYVPGGFKPAKIFAHMEEGGHIILDNVAFRK